MQQIATCDSPGGGGGAVRTPCPHLDPSMNEELVQLLSEHAHDLRAYRDQGFKNHSCNPPPLWCVYHSYVLLIYYLGTAQGVGRLKSRGSHMKFHRGVPLT